MSVRGVAVPHWLLVLITALPLARWLRRRLIARHRRKGGRCVACGYDLRGSAPKRGGACPECGAATGEVPGAGAKEAV